MFAFNYENMKRIIIIIRFDDFWCGLSVRKAIYCHHWLFLGFFCISLPIDNTGRNSLCFPEQSLPG